MENVIAIINDRIIKNKEQIVKISGEKYYRKIAGEYGLKEKIIIGIRMEVQKRKG